jgi:hypothetical protein
VSPFQHPAMSIKRRGFKGGNQRQGERPGDKVKERKGYATQTEERKGCTIQMNDAQSKTKKT